MDKQFFESLPMPIKAFLIEYDFLYQLDLRAQGLALYFKRELNSRFRSIVIVTDGLVIVKLMDIPLNCEAFGVIVASFEKEDETELVEALAHFESVCEGLPE